MLNRLLGMSPNASEHGFLIDHMLEFCHWFMLALFVGWSAFFLYTIVRFHKSRNPKADYHGVKTHASTHLEFMVVLVEAILLLGFALPLWANRVTDFPKTDAVRVRVIGQQFAWNFHYPGPDGVFGRQSIQMISSANQIGLDRQDPAAMDDIVTLNEMHLPFNRNIVLEISSKDVIHSFMVHQLRTGQDATPGSNVPLWFRSIRPGTYEIICAQLCGLGHYNMRATMVVESQKEFEEWIAEMAQLSGGSTAAPSTAPAPGPSQVPESGAQSPSAPVPSQLPGDSSASDRPSGSETPASGKLKSEHR
jgi:cytochrome c oxidase subunit 2